jgi:hypothetical protein
MNDTYGAINRVASWIPSTIRGVIYALIGLFWLLEAIWNIIPDTDTGGRVAATITLLGMLMAAGNTNLIPETDPVIVEGPPPRDRGESTLMTILIVLAIIVLVAVILGWLRF